jgi:hypothetical protein
VRIAKFQRSQLFSIRRGQAKCRIVGNCGELWKVRKVILGEIVVELWGIMGEYGEKGRKMKSFVV